MDRDNFLEGINRLRGAFGQNNFPQEKEDLLNKKIGYINNEDWENIIDSVIMSFRYAPTINEFLETIKKWQMANQDRHAPLEATPFLVTCFDCYNTGWIFCKIKEKAHETMMYCHCDEGVDLCRRQALEHNKIPAWKKDTHDKSFGFIRLPFPLKDFQPKEEEKETLAGNLVKSLLSKKTLEILSNWKRKECTAKIYWGEYYQAQVRNQQ